MIEFLPIIIVILGWYYLIGNKCLEMYSCIYEDAYKKRMTIGMKLFFIFCWPFVMVMI